MMSKLSPMGILLSNYLDELRVRDYEFFESFSQDIIIKIQNFLEWSYLHRKIGVLIAGEMVCKENPKPSTFDWFDKAAQQLFDLNGSPSTLKSDSSPDDPDSQPELITITRHEFINMVKRIDALEKQQCNLFESTRNVFGILMKQVDDLQEWCKRNNISSLKQKVDGLLKNIPSIKWVEKYFQEIENKIERIEKYEETGLQESNAKEEPPGK